MKRNASENTEINDINLAISFNNKAVLELKHNNIIGAKECSIRAIQLLETKVFGIIQSGLVSTKQNKELYVHFTRILQVLLVAYYNLGASMEGQLESKDIYLKGLQLSYQYLEGGQSSQMFQRFYAKYNRNYYRILSYQT